MESIPCNLCGATVSRIRFKRRGFSIVECECGLVYTNPRLGEDELAAMYSETSYFNAASDEIGYQDYDATSDLRQRTFMRWFDEISRHMPRPGKLLDVGCATGLFLEVARNRGWDVTGVELSSFAAEKARSKGFRIIGTRLGETDWGNETFNLVTMFDTIEHLPDPMSEASTVRKILAPDGLFAVITPNIASLHARIAGSQWFLLKPEEHLYFFTLTTLQRLLERNRFLIIDARASKQYQKLDFLARRVECYSKLCGSFIHHVLLAFRLADVAMFVDSSCIYVVARAI
jgi:2-polyprenyl-3-methyl-5-hydroxy-6-metoxy-1,4-benzoquinol methylase